MCGNVNFSLLDQNTKLCRPENWYAKRGSENEKKQRIFQFNFMLISFPFFSSYLWWMVTITYQGERTKKKRKTKHRGFLIFRFVFFF